MSIKQPSREKSGSKEIADAELEKVVGGDGTKTTTKTTTTKGTGSQSTGAGAGKVTF